LECADDGQPPLSLVTALAIAVLDVNEAPRMLVPSGATVVENADAGTVVGSVTTLDPDLLPTGGVGSDPPFRYDLVTDTGEATTDPPFRVVETDGNAVLVTTRPLNFEQTPHVIINLRTMDAGGLSLTKTFTVTVLDGNDPPMDIALSPQSVPEGVPGAVVGRLSVSDEDAGQTHTYILADPLTTDISLFRINAVSHTLALAAGVVVDYEQTQTLRVAIEVRDSGTPLSRTVRRTFAIAVRDINEPVTTIAFVSADGRTSVPEASVPGTLLGRLDITDADNANPALRQQVHTCVVDGGDGMQGGGDNGGGGMYARGTDLFLGTGALDYERQPRLRISVTCTDDGSPPSALQTWLALEVANDNEPPGDVLFDGLPLRDAAVVLAENNNGQVRLGRLSASDPDNACRHAECPPLQTHMFAVAGAAAAHFAVIDGVLWTAGRPLDYENQTALVAVAGLAHGSAIPLTLTDSGAPPLTVVLRLPLHVLDANDAPTAVALLLNGAAAVPENSSAHMLVGRLRAVDDDSAAGANGRHTFWINYASAAGHLPFVVHGDGLYVASNGETAAAILDYERRPVYTFEVYAQDGGTPPLTTSSLVRQAQGPGPIPRRHRVAYTRPPTPWTVISYLHSVPLGRQ